MNSDFWQNKNVLVTGGTGFIGSHLVEKLLQAGANITITFRDLDPRSYFALGNFQQYCTMAICDIKDYLRVRDVITRHEIEYIFHLAAQPIEAIAYQNPFEALQTNISGTINVLEAARYCPQVQGIVVASSDKAYGRHEVLPYCEDTHHLQGENPYDVSKSCADLITQMYSKTYNLPVTISRFGNVYGGGDLNFNRIIPGAIYCAIKKIPLKLRSDGKMTREYIYVKDVADGYLLMGQNIEKTSGEAFNFGSGEKYSVLEIVKKVGEIYGSEIKIEILNNAVNEIPEQYLNYEKIKNLLGWDLNYQINDALLETIDWYKKIIK